jgi:outer membrane protein with beta-barrel domain
MFMKAKFSVLIACVFIAQATMAQFHIGFKAGTNIDKIEGKTFKDEFRYGYHLGGFVQAGIGGGFSIQPEVLFSQYSTTLDSNYKNIYQNVFTNQQSHVKLSYLIIPVLLDYKLLGPIHLQAGPQFGVLINRDQNLLQNGGNAFKNGDFSMVGGASINISKIRVSGRFVIGLNNINDIDKQDKWKSQALQLSLGLAL